MEMYDYEPDPDDLDKAAAYEQKLYKQKGIKLLVKILNVDVENVVKGKSRYSIANVAYMVNGEARTQKVLDFANPAVFKQLPGLVGQDVIVTVTKNDAGYNQWSAIGDSAQESSAQSSGQSVPRTGGPASTGPSNSSAGTTPPRPSTFETPAERANKQVYIVKQSSLSSAIALASGNKEKATAEDIIKTAQQFVDYVFGTPDTSKMETLESDVL